MRTTFSVILLGLCTGGVIACDTTVCGEGTIDRNGHCEGADVTVSNASCGPGTELMAGQCLPTTTPTVCDPATTTPMVDPDTGITTCIGTGGGGCASSLPCTQPTDGSKQTICGQIYNLETFETYAATGATGTQCTAGTATDGPCAMGILAFDAYDFATNPAGATKLSTGPVYIDDCGRYRIPDVPGTTSGFIGLGFDDADSSKMGSSGITNGVGITISQNSGTATKDVDGWFAPKSTTDKFGMNGGPSLATGYFVGIYFAKKAPDRSLQMGVTPTHLGTTNAATDYFFSDSDDKRTMIDAAASATGHDGTALVTGADPNDNFAWSGTGGLPASCKYTPSTEAHLPGLLIVQEYRPVNNGAQTCNP